MSVTQKLEDEPTFDETSFESVFELASVTAMFGSTNTPDTSLDDASASFCPNCPHCVAKIPLAPSSDQAPPSASINSESH